MKKPQIHVRAWTMGLVCSLLLVGMTFTAQAQTDEQDRSGELVIRYKAGSDGSRNSYSPGEWHNASNYAGEALFFIRKTGLGSDLVRLPSVRAIADAEAVAERIQGDPDVEYAHPNYPMRLQAFPVSAPNDPSFGEQWNLAGNWPHGINARNAWPLSLGRNVAVGVIDTGSRPHPDLIGNLLPGYDFVPAEDSDGNENRDGDGPDPDPTDMGIGDFAGACKSWLPGKEYPAVHTASSWHGTHVAGIIAATTDNDLGIAGVAPRAKIVPVKAIGRCGLNGHVSWAEGLLWVAGVDMPDFPVNPNPARIVNVSLGYGMPKTTKLHSPICRGETLAALRIVQQRTLVVASAGNESSGAELSSPGACPEAFGVSASNRDGERANYSNYGATVDVAAPGGEFGENKAVYSLWNGGFIHPGAEDRYDWLSGTSMAAPHVAGVAALMLEVNPSLSVAELKDKLRISAQPFRNECKGCGHGIVDARAAVDAARGNLLSNEEGAFINSGASASQKYYTFVVPAGISSLSFQLSPHPMGSSGDADLYVRHAADPTLSTYHCRSWRSNNTETCEIDALYPGLYHVMVRGYRAYQGVIVTASYTHGDNLVYTNDDERAVTDHRSVESWLQVSRRGTASKAFVGVELDHTYLGDLRIWLVNPNGGTYLLHNREYGSKDNLRDIYEVDLGNVETWGNWRLRISDLAGGDEGTLRGFNLTIVE